MTETRSTDRTDRQTMADVNHVHHYDPGAHARFYGRGPTAMTDGGENANDEIDESEDEEAERGHERRPTMRDVSHTPPDGDREVNRVFERGEEGRERGR